MSSSGLENALAKARETLNSGILTDEAKVRAAVVAPLLNALGWDPADPKQWLVEYAVGAGKVDDALFGPGGSALVFIEVKKPGNLSPKAEDQLFRYASNKGVPLLVLTDGNAWHLYLSMAAGEPTERRFCHHEIKTSRDLSTMASDMRRYLSREAVVQGQAKSDAEQRLDDILNREQGRKALPVAWQTLLTAPDELLRDLLIESAEQATGSRPWREDAEAFLRQSSGPPGGRTRHGDVIAWLHAAPADLTSEMKAAVTKWRKQLNVSRPVNLRGFRHGGEMRPAKNGSETLTLLASVLEQHKPRFLAELAALGSPDVKWPRALRPGDARLEEPTAPSYRPVNDHGDWLLLVHGSTLTKLKWMQQMVEMAGLVWASDIEPLFESPST